jgi:hypothetical protein
VSFEIQVDSWCLFFYRTDVSVPHLSGWLVDRGTGTPKDRDEVNRREVCECDGWVCDLDVMGSPPKLSVIRKAAA